jgi:hypothetical protein
MAYRQSSPALGASGSVNACVIFNILMNPYSTVLLYGKITAGISCLALIKFRRNASASLEE